MQEIFIYVASNSTIDSYVKYCCLNYATFYGLECNQSKQQNDQHMFFLDTVFVTYFAHTYLCIILRFLGRNCYQIEINQHLSLNPTPKPQKMCIFQISKKICIFRPILYNEIFQSFSLTQNQQFSKKDIFGPVSYQFINVL